MTELAVVTYDDPQERADELVPIGWCNPCVGEAKGAEALGAEPLEIHAGVTMMAIFQQLEGPDGSKKWVVITAPACMMHIDAKRSSPLVT